MSDGPYAGLGLQGRAAAWQRWRMAAFDAPAQPESHVAAESELAEPAQPLPTPEEVLEAARQEGHAQGLRQGHEEGRLAGHAEGHAAGLAEGRAAGHAEGYAAGLAEGREQIQEQIRRLTLMADNLADSVRALEEDIGQGLITLALDVARQVVAETLAHHPEAVVAAVRQVLHADPSAAGPLRIWIHPDDLPLINEHLADEIIEGKWRVMTDATLTRGGCRAETAFGAIDATLQTRWRRVAASLGRKDEWESGQ